MKTTFYLTIAVIVVSFAVVSHAELIAWDSFATTAEVDEYYEPGSIQNQNPIGGCGGFNGAWSSGTSAFEAALGGLIHPLTPGETLEGKLVSYMSNGTVGGGNARNLYRAIDYTPSDDTYYMSLLINKSSASQPRHMFVGLGAAQHAETDIYAVEGAWTGAYEGGIWFGEGPGPHLDPVLLGSQMNTDETYFALLQYDFSTSGPDSVTTTIYDSSSQEVAGPQVFSGLDLDDSMGQFSVLTQDFGPNPAVDEWRFGTELSDVMVLPPLAGDFDGDGDVDGFDFLKWQRDPDVGNLTDWEANYGTPAPLAAATTVPEPTTCALALAATLVLAMSRHRVFFCASATPG